MTSKSITGIIILAAGSSSGSDHPKQNLVYHGQTLLQRAIETALSTISETVMVVLGSDAEAISPTINYQQINIIQTDASTKDMASTIGLGITKILEINPGINSVIIMSYDQPFIDTHILNMLMIIKPKSGIATCGYNDIIGLPALFDKVYFNELLALKDDVDLRKLFTKYATVATIIPFEQGAFDINTLKNPV